MDQCWHAAEPFRTTHGDPDPGEDPFRGGAGNWPPAPLPPAPQSWDIYRPRPVSPQATSGGVRLGPSAPPGAGFNATQPVPRGEFNAFCHLVVAQLDLIVDYIAPPPAPLRGGFIKSSDLPRPALKKPRPPPIDTSAPVNGRPLKREDAVVIPGGGDGGGGSTVATRASTPDLEGVGTPIKVESVED